MTLEQAKYERKKERKAILEEIERMRALIETKGVTLADDSLERIHYAAGGFAFLGRLESWIRDREEE